MGIQPPYPGADPGGPEPTSGPGPHPLGPWWSPGQSVQFPAMNDQKKTKAQLIEELDGLLGEAVV